MLADSKVHFCPSFVSTLCPIWVYFWGSIGPLYSTAGIFLWLGDVLSSYGFLCDILPYSFQLLRSFNFAVFFSTKIAIEDFS